MKKAWMTLAAALMLLAGCVPQPEAGLLPTQAPGHTDAAAPARTAAPVKTAAPAAVQTAAPPVKTAAQKTAEPDAPDQAPAYWPAGVPENVPVFDYGTHVQTTVNGGEVTIVCSGVTVEDFAGYRKRLTTAGFFLAKENIDPEGVCELSMNGPNCVISLRVTKDGFAQWKYSPAG